MVIKYFTIDNLIQPKMESREKAPGVNNMGEKILEQGVKKSLIIIYIVIYPKTVPKMLN